MAVNEVGRYTGAAVNEVGVRIFSATDEVGVDVFGAAAADAAAFQTDAFQGDLKAFQLTPGLTATLAAGLQPAFGENYDAWEPPEDGFWVADLHLTTIDAIPAFQSILTVASDEVQSAQDYTEAYQFDSGLDEQWYSNVYGFPDQSLDPSPAFADTPVETFATQPFPDHDHATLVPPETEDYGPDSSLEVGPAFADTPVETFATQPLPEHDFDTLVDPETTDYANDSSLDVTPQFFPPAAGITDAEAQATQPLAEQPWFPEAETEDYQPGPEQNEWTAPPEVPSTELLAAQPHFGEAFWDEQPTEDYGPDPSLDTPTEWFPPPTDAELLAAQPLAEHDFDLLTPLETADYANDSTLDISVQIPPPPANTDVEIQAAAQLAEHDHATLVPEETSDYAAPPEQNEWLAPPEASTDILNAAIHGLDPQTFAEDATEDYANDSTLDIVAPFIAPTPDETLAAQPHYGELPILEAEPDDYSNDSTLDVPSVLLNIPSDSELAAAQPHPEGPWLDPEETQDYAADSTLDVTWGTPATPQEPDTTFAAQPQFPEPLEPEDTSDYANDTTLDVSAIPLAEPIETFAAQPHFGEYIWPEDETTDYQPELDALPAFAPTPDETYAAQPLPHDLIETLTDVETDDYIPQSSLDVAAQLFPPLAIEVIAAQPHYGEWLLEPEELTVEDGHVTALDTPVLVPVPSGLGQTLVITKRGMYQPTLARGGTYVPTITKRATYVPTITRRGVWTPTITKRGTYRPTLS